MEDVHKNSRLRRIAKAAGFTFSTLFALALLLQFILWGGFHWLNGGDGQGWLLRQLDSAMAGSGYSAKLNGLHMSVFGTLTADEWQLSDAAGPLAEGKGLRLHVSLASALHKTLALRLYASAASVLRLPESGDAPAPASGPFSLPEFYFHRIALESLRIDALTIDKEVAGRALVLTPDLKGDVAVTASGATFNLSGGVTSTDKSDSAALFLPREITARGGFDASAQQLTLQGLTMDAPAYSLAAKGTSGLGQRQAVELTATVKNPDLAAVTGASLAGTGQATLDISGTVAAPQAKISGLLQHLVIKGENYPDVTLVMEAENIFAKPAGKFQLSGKGNSPALLDGKFLINGSELALNQLKGIAVDSSLSGDFSYNMDTGIATGAANISANLAAYQKLLGIPIGGRLKVSATFSGENGLQSCVLEAHGANLSYQQLHLGKGNVKLALADVWQRWPDDVRLHLENLAAGEFALPVTKITLEKSSPAQYRLTADGAADYRGRVKFAGSANIAGSSWADAAADNIKLNLKPLKGTALLTGRASMKDADLSLALNGVALAQLPANLGKVSTNGTIKLQGSYAAPELTGELQSTVPSPALSIVTTSSYRNGAFKLDANGRGRGIDQLEAHVTAPLQLSLVPWKLSSPEKNGMAGKLALRGDAGKLSPLFLDPAQSLQGRINAQLALSGGFASPVVTGPISLAAGKFTARNLGVALQDISVNAAIGRDTITVTSASATDGRKGSVKAAGTASRNGGAAKIDITVRNMDVSRFNENVAGRLSAALNLTGGGGGYVLKGKVTPDDLAITIPERFRSDIPKLNIVTRHGKKPAVGAAGGSALALNVTLDAPDRVMVRGWGLDAEFGGKLDISGTAAAPQVNGQLQSRRGRYEEFGKRFTISRAILQFNGPVPPSPFLDVLAETKAEDITGQVTLTGPVSKPVIAFTSVPALPQDEVLSRILFGKGMEKISPFQAIQLARTLQRFSGKGSGPDPLGALRGATGLDDIDVENSAEGGTTVGAGKYITDKVYLEVGSGTGKKSGAAKVQVELTPKVKLESKIGQDSQAGAGVTWGWDY